MIFVAVSIDILSIYLTKAIQRSVDVIVAQFEEWGYNGPCYGGLVVQG